MAGCAKDPHFKVVLSTKWKILAVKGSGQKNRQMAQKILLVTNNLNCKGTAVKKLLLLLAQDYFAIIVSFLTPLFSFFSPPVSSFTPTAFSANNTWNCGFFAQQATSFPKGGKYGSNPNF